MSKKKQKHICKQCGNELNHFDCLFYHWQKVVMALEMLESEERITDKTYATLLESMMSLKGLVLDHDAACNENDPE